MALTDKLIDEGWLKSPKIIEAFRKIKRVDFLPKYMRGLAELNEALPIGRGQTISQPLVVAFMMEKLQPREGDKVLDIGSGSGWTTAILAQLVGDRGKVIAMEIISELKDFGEKNVAKYSFISKGIVEFVCDDGSLGCPDIASRPGLAVGFDKILASAAGVSLPSEWKKQLKAGGRIVAPLKSSIWVFEKESEKHFIETEYPGFAFVPLITGK
jgi:protein-L-isoaspartate(D-aspartate) O-methyltransferase